MADFIPAFGRIESPDPNDTAYLMRAKAELAPSVDELPSILFYKRGPILNQGDTGTCVGQSWRAKLSGEPIRTSKGPSAERIYLEACKRDLWTENDDDPTLQAGTSVRAGAAYLKELGYITSYVWAFNVDDLMRWMLEGRGGVVLGINWTSGMNQPDHEGIIRVTGPSEGGHAIYAFGIDRARGVIALQNSWGMGWGGWVVNRRKAYLGCGLLALEDLEHLLRRGGEACTALEQRTHDQMKALSLTEAPPVVS